ncbi:hypothetical protein [Azospirillum sp. sgz301742]
MERIDTFQIGDSGPWSTVELRDADPRSARIVERLCLFGQPQQWWIEQRRLPYFRTGRLLRATFTAGVHGCRFFGMESARDLVRLHNESSYEEALRIGEAEACERTAEDILRFYFHPRIFAEGRVHLVERAGDVAWHTLAATADHRQAVDVVARRLLPIGRDRDGIRFSATIKIGCDLFAANGLVDANGRVTLDIGAMLLGELPCTPGRWYDPARGL